MSDTKVKTAKQQRQSAWWLIAVMVGIAIAMSAGVDVGGIAVDFLTGR